MIFATNGAKFYIGGPIGAQDTELYAEDFAGQTWVEVKHTETLGSAGDTSSEISINLVDQMRTKRMKGTRDAGSMEIVAAFDSADAGQAALIAAEKTDYDYAFRLVLKDAPVGGTPSARFFVAQVGSVVESYDSANGVVKLNATLWINSNIARVNAAPAVPADPD